MKNLFLTIALTLATVVGINAQSATTGSTFNEKSDIYVGYQFVRQNFDQNTKQFAFNQDTDSHGVVGAYTYYFGNKSAGLTSQVGVNFGKNDNVLATYMSGVTVKRRTGTLQPFVKGLVGVGTQKVRNGFTSNFNRTNSGLAFSGGAGLDIRLSDKISFRLIQADYLQTRVFNTTQNNVSLSTGFVF